MANNRICKVCGNSYKFCPNCNENLANPKPSWYKLYDSEECKTIFDTAVKFYYENISATEAKKILSNCNTDKVKDNELNDILKKINEVKPVKQVEFKNIVKELD